ncbi:hypothetical protein RSOLAG22IIIB_12155 [Rhizoctonia solani]|uniref:F-box domain-containing protein n=1 Tax=Rhizoctonia solani TaxID=456999 RepID=A0A0K6GCP2_9AGAM|nr:hypothetical protein RSOLAG22IIIB_12155 [Rhizoctonia solani]
MIPLITSSVTQWEEADHGTSLANALTQPPLSDPRNEITLPRNHLPGDVLVEIFAHVIFSSPYQDVHDSVTEMEDHLLKIYRQIHTLLEVCTYWNRTLLSRGCFWYIIPIYRAPKPSDRDSRELYEKYRRATLASLARARGHRLDIAAVFGPDFSGEDFDILKEYLPRTRTINIVASEPSGMRNVMDTIIHSSSSLLELSICQKQAEQFYRRLPEVHDSVYPPESSDLAHFTQILRSVPALRVSGVHMHWNKLVFSDRLTKLRLQAINFGTDRAMIGCLCRALVSATGLRELELVSIRSFYTTGTLLSLGANVAPLSFSNLESLLVDNLCYNTLLFLFKSIVSRTHRLILHLTQDSQRHNYPGISYRRDTGAKVVRLLQGLLKQTPVHTLHIDAAIDLTPNELGQFIDSIPMVDTLILDEVKFGIKRCHILERPENLPDEPFPSFQYLHFSQATIEDMAAFKSMVASHSQSMRKVVLGGHIRIPGSSGLHFYRSGDDEAKDKEIISQFEGIVPEFRLTNSDHVPLDFQHNAWQLW